MLKEYIRCEPCDGIGIRIKIHLNTSTTYILCDMCNGTGKLEVDDELRKILIESNAEALIFRE